MYFIENLEQMVLYMYCILWCQPQLFLTLSFQTVVCLCAEYNLQTSIADDDFLQDYLLKMYTRAKEQNV